MLGIEFDDVDYYRQSGCIDINSYRVGKVILLAFEIFPVVCIVHDHRILYEDQGHYQEILRLYICLLQMLNTHQALGNRAGATRDFLLLDAPVLIK